MNDSKIISKISSTLRSKKIFWVNGDYVRNGEPIHWECYLKLLQDEVAVGFDEYLEKYEDAVDLYDVYVRERFPNIELALRFILDSFPLAAEKMRQI